MHLGDLKAWVLNAPVKRPAALKETFTRLQLAAIIDFIESGSWLAGWLAGWLALLM